MSDPITHSCAFELLPWLVNSSLFAEERDAVEQHVRSCLSCRRELKEQQRLRTAVRAQPTIHLSAQAGYERLTRVLGGAPLPEAPRRAHPVDGIVRFAAAAAAALALVAIVLWLAPAPRGTHDESNYRVLATDAANVAGELDVVFARSITAAEMQALLAEIDGSISDGPSEVGRYTIRLGDSNVTDAQLDALLARLAADPRVRFAGRALGTPNK